jgi:hypothetical protein
MIDYGSLLTLALARRGKADVCNNTQSSASSELSKVEANLVELPLLLWF